MGRWLDFESNPWGQEVLQGVSLDLMYLAIGLAVLFTLGHWFWYRRRGFSKQEEVAEAQGSACLLYTSPSQRDKTQSRKASSA